MLQGGRAEKVDEKMGYFCSFYYLSWVMILKLSKKCIFSVLCWPQKKSNYVKPIYIHASVGSCYTLSANVIVYYAMT